MKLFSDFKKFAFKGNIMDMAIGIVIGAAFTTIINSLVNDIIMPVIGVLTAGIQFNEIKFVMKEAVVDASGAVVTPESAIRYGLFIQNIVYFFIIAVSCFLMIRIINNSLNKAKNVTAKIVSTIRSDKPDATPAEQPAAEQPAATANQATANQEDANTEERLLTEIRDLLKALAGTGTEPPAEPGSESEIA